MAKFIMDKEDYEDVIEGSDVESVEARSEEGGWSDSDDQSEEHSDQGEEDPEGEDGIEEDIAGDQLLPDASSGLPDFELMNPANHTKMHMSPYMNKYEIARVKGWRSQQLTAGAPSTIRADEIIDGELVFVDGVYPINTKDIVMKELEFRRCPAKIARTLPNGEMVLVSTSALKLP